MTEREKVLLQREAADRALRHAGWGWALPDRGAQVIAEYLNEKFPLPKITRPREVRAFNAVYRYVDGVLQYRYQTGDVWRSSPSPIDDHAAIASLRDTPTETVDDDGSA